MELNDEEIADVREENTSFFQYNPKLIPLVVVVVGFAVFWVVLVSVSAASMAPQQTLETRVQTENIMTHLDEFQKIALANNNSRSIVNGYNDSAEYVISTLQQEAGDYYQIRKEYFSGVTSTILETPTLSQVFPGHDNRNAIVFEDMIDFRQPRYGGDGKFDLQGKRVILVGGVGCEASDYLEIQECVDSAEGGCVALLPRSSDCTLYDSAVLAESAGALAVLASGPLTNTRVRDTWWTPDSTLVTIPTFSVTNSVSSSLLSLTPSYVDLTANLEVGVHPTYNVIAQGKGGIEKDGAEKRSGSQSVFVGAHLDSVAAGPGLNDNGSGSATILEIAIQVSKIGGDLNNPVRFAWWGAEEEGLIGSRHYVAQLSDSEKSRIAVYMNHDMLASPNYIINVKNATDAPLVTKPGQVVQGMYEDYYNTRKVPFMNGPLQGGSDFLSFLEGDVPAHGMSAGAGEIKTDEGRTLYGGLADAPLDPCYHRACDTIDNINQQCLTDISQATSNVLWSLLNKDNLASFLGRN